jgi:hypothetical protein
MGHGVGLQQPMADGKVILAHAPFQEHAQNRSAPISGSSRHATMTAHVGVQQFFGQVTNCRAWESLGELMQPHGYDVVITGGKLRALSVFGFGLVSPAVDELFHRLSQVHALYGRYVGKVAIHGPAQGMSTELPDRLTVFRNAGQEGHFPASGLVQSLEPF